MTATQAKFLALCVLLSIYLSGIGVAFLINNDFGKLDVKSILISNGGKWISGLLYRPISATAENPQPAIILAHGISGSKQMLSGIALELARQGFVALSIDLVGHGNSEGVFGGDLTDPSLGALAAVRYLDAQPYVEGFRIGLVGHSLGAGAIRAAAVAHGNISASVYIAGGLGEVVAGPAYGMLNSTYPKNLLIAVGEYDVLFDIGQLKRELGPAFGVPREAVPYVLYGNFSCGTARKLITPSTMHLFEPMDPTIVSEIVLWMDNALRATDSRPRPIQGLRLNYLYREAAILVSALGFVGLAFSISSLIFDSHLPSARGMKARYGTLEDWKTLVIWGILGLTLFLPMFIMGSIISYPPLIFGSSFAWWLLAVAIVGFLMIVLVVPKLSAVRSNPKEMVHGSFDFKRVVVAVGVFTLLYLIANLVEAISLVDLRIFVIPMFNDLMPVTRMLTFFTFVPFAEAYFLVEGLYFHELHDWSAHEGRLGMAKAVIKAIGIKAFPYAALLGVNYVPMIWFDARLLPTFMGFIAEFFWGILPQFIIAMTCSWWFYWKTSKVGGGATFNALLIAWSAAATFPFGASNTLMRFI